MVANTYDHIVPRCVALLYCAPVLLWSGDFDGASTHIDALFEQAAKYSLGPFRAASLSLKGQLMLAQGHPRSGVTHLREALTAMDVSQHNILKFATWGALAEGLSRIGRPDEALATIEEALAHAEQSQQVLWLPDLLRARGEILLALPQPDPAAAEAALLRSTIDCAAGQSALSWELKAALPLARLWRDRKQGVQAKALLESVYGRYTEGFGTKDLVAARRLLDEIASVA